MANMSYCRCENTYKDLKQVWDEIENPEELSESEKRYFKKLVKLCSDIHFEFSDDNLNDE